MKRRFKYFLDTYFYFNHQERKGLISLILLIVFIQLAALLYANLQVNLPADIRQISSSEIQFLTKDSLQANTRSAVIYSDFKESGQIEKNGAKFIKNKYKKDSVFTYSPAKKIQTLNLNETDSIALVGLPKIGPVLAGRIIQYRNKLGGFHSTNQLTEVWGFKEDLLYDLQDRIFVDGGQRFLMDINTVSIDQLKSHPYFKFTLSQAIINYRKQHGRFQSISDLKKIKVVNDSIFNLISPYCTY